MALSRGLWLDLPLTWTMEVSRFASKELQEQIDHWIRLTGCANFHAVVDEQTRFVRQSVAELDDVVEALAREAWDCQEFVCGAIVTPTEGAYGDQERHPGPASGRP